MIARGLLTHWNSFFGKCPSWKTKEIVKIVKQKKKMTMEKYKRNFYSNRTEKWTSFWTSSFSVFHVDIVADFVVSLFCCCVLVEKKTFTLVVVLSLGFSTRKIIFAFQLIFSSINDSMHIKLEFFIFFSILGVMFKNR